MSKRTVARIAKGVANNADDSSDVKMMLWGLRGYFG